MEKTRQDDRDIENYTKTDHNCDNVTFFFQTNTIGFIYKKKSWFLQAS